QDWVTINEPNVYLEGTYSAGNFPPNKPNFFNFFKAAKYMVRAHIRAYESIHAIRRAKNHPGKTIVGATHYLRVFDIDHTISRGFLLSCMLVYVFHNIFL